MVLSYQTYYATSPRRARRCAAESGGYNPQYFFIHDDALPSKTLRSYDSKLIDNSIYCNIHVFDYDDALPSKTLRSYDSKLIDNSI